MNPEEQAQVERPEKKTLFSTPTKRPMNEEPDSPLSENQRKFASAYFDWKMRWRSDEPKGSDFLISPSEESAIKHTIHRQFELDRLAHVRQDNKQRHLKS